MSSTTKKKPPITSHPVFPVTVALWFAALLGMGSLLVHPGLLESVVLAIRLDRLIPAASPPLGFTARTLVAILLACAGGMVGYGAGRALGATTAPRRETPTPPARRGRPADTVPGATPAPVEAAATDDNDDLARLEAAREGNPARRRGLNAQLVADPFATPAPFTIGEPAILNLGDLTAIDPIGLVVEPQVPEAASPPAALPAAPVAHEVAPAPDPGPALAATPPAPTPATPPAPAAPLFKPRQGSAAELLRQAPLDTLGVVELAERFAMALADRRARETAAAAAANTAPVAPQAAPGPVIFGAADSGTSPPRPFDMPGAESPRQVPRGPIEWLNGSEPIDRTPAPVPAHSPVPHHAHSHAHSHADHEPEEGHLRSLDEGGWALPELDDEPDCAEPADDDFAEFHAPPAMEDSAAPGEPAEQAFSSLLAMKPAARAAALSPQLPSAPNGAAGGFARAAGASPEATEDALRKALATLQRMSGAA